jgi:8-oxo-dGTP diphosphatase
VNKAQPKCGLILDDGTGRILLQLRDDKPDIPFPNCWGTFGGAIEPGETPEAAITREIKEELDLDLKDFHYFGNFPHDGYNVHMFYSVDPSLKLQDLNVKEGQRAEFMKLDRVRQVTCAFNCREIVEYYFAKVRKD